MTFRETNFRRQLPQTLFRALIFFAVAARCFAAEPGGSRVDPEANYSHANLFGIDAQGDKIVYVFDRSESMGEVGGKPIREAKKQLVASVNGLDQRSQFYLIFYNDQTRLADLGTARGHLVWATSTNKRQAEEVVSNIQASGGTDHMAALTAALRLQPDVIFLMTDGEAQDDPTPEDLKRIDHMNGGSAQINVIQFAGAPRPDSSLVTLAKQNRGKHVFVDIMHYGEGKPAGQ